MWERVRETLIIISLTLLLSHFFFFIFFSGWWIINWKCTTIALLVHCIVLYCITFCYHKNHPPPHSSNSQNPQILGPSIVFCLLSGFYHCPFALFIIIVWHLQFTHKLANGTNKTDKKGAENYNYKKEIKRKLKEKNLSARRRHLGLVS